MSIEHKEPAPSEFYDTARSLYMVPCVCDGTPKLMPDGNRWEILCGCGRYGPSGDSPAIAAKNWNAGYRKREALATEAKSA